MWEQTAELLARGICDKMGRLSTLWEITHNDPGQLLSHDWITETLWIQYKMHFILSYF